MKPSIHNVVTAGAALLVALGLPSLSAHAADTVVASQDNYLRGDGAQLDASGVDLSVANWVGSPTSLTRHTVISFDLSTYTSDPDFVDFNSVILRLGQPSNGNAGTHVVNRLLRDFVEAEVDFNEYSSGNTWQTPGALGALDSVEIANGVASGASAGGEWAGGGLDVTGAANAWATAGDTTELGFLILPASNFQNWLYGSTESTGGPGPGPVLDVDANLTLTIVTSTNVTVADTLGVAFSSVSNTTYRLQSTPDLVSSNFSDTGATVTGNGGSMTLFDPTGPSTSKNYRVVDQ